MSEISKLLFQKNLRQAFSISKKGMSEMIPWVLFFFLRKSFKIMQDLDQVSYRSLDVGFANARGSRNTSPGAMGCS